MSLIIATGSNQGQTLENLHLAKSKLCDHFSFIQSSRIYHSAAVDYVDQPDFYNQVLEFKLPDNSPVEIMTILLQIENSMGI